MSWKCHGDKIHKILFGWQPHQREFQYNSISEMHSISIIRVSISQPMDCNRIPVQCDLTKMLVQSGYIVFWLELIEAKTFGEKTVWTYALTVFIKVLSQMGLIVVFVIISDWMLNQSFQNNWSLHLYVVAQRISLLLCYAFWNML